jgi:hypothetical protein
MALRLSPLPTLTSCSVESLLSIPLQFIFRETTGNGNGTTASNHRSFIFSKNECSTLLRVNMVSTTTLIKIQLICHWQCCNFSFSLLCLKLYIAIHRSRCMLSLVFTISADVFLQNAQRHIGEMDRRRGRGGPRPPLFVFGHRGNEDHIVEQVFVYLFYIFPILVFLIEYTQTFLHWTTGQYYTYTKVRGVDVDWLMSIPKLTSYLQLD